MPSVRPTLFLSIKSEKHMELRVIREDDGYGFANVSITDSERSIYCYSGSPNFLWAPTIEGLLEIVKEACSKPFVMGSNTKRYGEDGGEG